MGRKIILIIFMIAGILSIWFSGYQTESIIPTYSFDFKIWHQNESLDRQNSLVVLGYDFITKEGLISIFVPKHTKLNAITLTIPSHLQKDDLAIFTYKLLHPSDDGHFNDSKGEELAAGYININNFKDKEASGTVLKDFPRNVSGEMFKIKFKAKLQPNAYYRISRREYKKEGYTGVRGIFKFKFAEDYSCMKDCFQDIGGANQHLISTKESIISLDNQGVGYTNWFLINPKYKKTFLGRIDYENLLLGVGISLLMGSFLLLIIAENSNNKQVSKKHKIEVKKKKSKK